MELVAFGDVGGNDRVFSSSALPTFIEWGSRLALRVRVSSGEAHQVNAVESAHPDR